MDCREWSDCSSHHEATMDLRARIRIYVRTWYSWRLAMEFVYVRT